MISSLAKVSPGAHIGIDVSIGDFCVINENVVIGDGCTIQSHCLLGVEGANGGGRLVIGDNATIRSHAVIYGNSEIGPRLETGHHVVIRERSRIGENLRIGNFSDIEGDCTIGDFNRFHGFVQVGKGASIGHFVWLFSLTTCTNDPLPPSHLSRPVDIQDGAVVCVGATLMPGCRLGTGAFVAAGAMARGSVPDGAVVSGPDGRIKFHVHRLMDLDSGLSHPWMQHFRQIYPDHAQSRLDALLTNILASRDNDVYSRRKRGRK